MAILAWRSWQGPVVSTYIVKQQPLVQTVVASGRLENVSRTEIGSEISGIVLERRVQEGDQIQVGDLLLVIQSDDLKAQVREAENAIQELRRIRYPQAQVELQSAEFQLQQASREAKRRQNTEPGVLSLEEKEQAVEAERLARNNLAAARLKAQSLAPGQVEERTLIERLNALKAQLAKSEVRAQVAGTILTREVEAGDVVQPGKTLFTLAVDGPTQILVPLDEQNLPFLALGQQAQIIADAYPERPFPAQLSFIAPSIDPQRGTVDVKLSVNPVPDFLRQDMTVSVNIETARRDHALVINNDALFDIKGNKANVWVVRDHKLYRQNVEFGLKSATQVEILKGLKEGDQVLQDPAQGKLEQRVRIE
ncbi:efflux RND transporter periplasmic adaptor subunit [Acinetobacter sp. B51(2017)]|uniref:efflux RND transporter periplasmic adaptor subunit n=1 Tax=Acinetobacter sp. B51(2017) TaxID=2060938 RepID=UPI000F0849BB|nr:efflux RND transporter periplasmic adaptor subunit [Acinetobacter sp. B51(2017)]